MRTVLFPHSRDGLGGSVITGALIARELKKAGGWQPLVVCNTGGPVLDYHRGLGLEGLSLADATGLDYRPDPSDGNRLRRIAKRLFLIRAARRFLRSVSPDLIHVNDESSALAWGLAAYPRRIPVVWQVHQQLPQRTIDWLLRRLSSHVIFVAENNRVRFSNVTLPASSVVHNGVDLSVFSPRSEPSKHVPTVGFISNLVDRKRPGWVLSAAARLLREGTDVRVLMAGSDFSGGAKAAELSRLADREGMAGRYDYIGPRSDVPDVLRSLDVLALPSERNKEAFPRIVVEAMACGVPVVATEVAGVPEAVVNGETGILVDPDDFDAFAEALRTLVGDPALRSRYAAAAVSRCQTLFSLGRNVEAIDGIYRSVLRETVADEPRRAPG